MKPLRYAPYQLVIPARAVLVDTNILVAAFDPRDAFYEAAKDLLQLLAPQRESLVSLLAVVESWGCLVRGKRSMHPRGVELLAWASLEQEAILLSGNHAGLGGASDLANKLDIDLVDAWLMLEAHNLKQACELASPVRIATLDTRDFTRTLWRARSQFGLEFEVWDVRSNDVL